VKEDCTVAGHTAHLAGMAEPHILPNEHPAKPAQAG
jgi:hypothetical protein